LESSVREGGKILLFGEGGSAAGAPRIAAEFLIRYRSARAAIAAIALTTDTSARTACGDDVGLRNIFCPGNRRPGLHITACVARLVA
jgi:D-sedoheptulose 7-phosphate isomerase